VEVGVTDRTRFVEEVERRYRVLKLVLELERELKP
jgi:hypothetical protein